jgi:beta-fructofuranosidase
LYFTHECPDLFQIGEWWYLLFSEFSEACVTRYRMARDPRGPWITPKADTFDGRAFYAAKSAGDGERRYLFGWNPTRAGEKDQGEWQWGGNLVTHEIFQRADGTLGVLCPEQVRATYDRPVPIHFQRGLNATYPAKDAVHLDIPGGYGAALAGKLPERCKIEVRATWTGRAKGLGVLLRSSADFETGYWVRLEPQRGRLVIDSWPRPGEQTHWVEVERPADWHEGEPVGLTILVDGSLCEIYCGREIALSTRLYDHPEGEWGVFAQEGRVEFREIRLFTPGED